MKRRKQSPSTSSNRMGSMLFLIGVLVLVFFGVRKILDMKKIGSVTSAPAVSTLEAPAGIQVIPTNETLTDLGLNLAFAIKPVSSQADLTEVSFKITDATTGKPIALSAPPLVWIGSQQTVASGNDILSCPDKVKLYVQETLDYRPEIDLNSYFVLTLNKDPSISVIDPLGGVTGISQLYAMVELKSPGEDWVMSADGKKLFVSLPKVNQVAVIDTDNFSVLKYIDSGKNPTRIALQPDGRYVWVANDTDSLRSAGVTVIDAKSLNIATTIPTGTGQHEIAFSGEVLNLHAHDGQPTPQAGARTTFAFISNQQGTISVVDITTLDFVASVDVGQSVSSLGYSSLSNTIYVATQGSNGVTLIDASTHEITGQMTNIAPGVETIRFAPGGRWGFALSPSQNQVAIIDATNNQIVHSLTVTGAPDKVSFTAGYAYIHSAKKPEVALIDLNQVANSDKLSMVNVIGGQVAPDQADAPLSVADAVIAVHEHGGHVLITNPGDQSIYYYMEGMNAPMGSFQTYSRTPRAVRVVDRAIQETAPGVYTATVKIPHHGKYEAALMLDAPRVLHCFAFSTVTDEAAISGNNQSQIPKPALQFLTTERTVKKGEQLLFKFKITDAQTQTPIADLTDIYVLAALVSGQRNDRFKSTSIGAGMYEVDLTFAEAGIYKIYFAIPSLQVKIDDLPFLTMKVNAP